MFQAFSSDAIKNRCSFTLSKRRGLIRRATDETHHARGLFNQMPGVVVPVWGQGHFFDFLTFRSILQRTLGYLVSQRMLGGQKHNWGLAHEDFAHSEPVYEISF